MLVFRRKYQETFQVFYVCFFWILLDLLVDTAGDRKVCSYKAHVVKSKRRIEISRFHISHVEHHQSADRETVLRVRSWTDGRWYFISASSVDVQHESSTQPQNRVNHVAASVDGRTVPAEVVVVLDVQGRWREDWRGISADRGITARIFTEDGGWYCNGLHGRQCQPQPDVVKYCSHSRFVQRFISSRDLFFPEIFGDLLIGRWQGSIQTVKNFSLVQWRQGANPGNGQSVPINWYYVRVGVD